MNKRLKWVELDPDRWLRGGKLAPVSRLLDKEGQMCCMGFAAMAYGIPPEEILDKHYVCRKQKFIESFSSDEDYKGVYGINDRNTLVSDRTRVRSLNKRLVFLKAPFRFFLKGERA